ncbi:hypothetical protein HAALTHF_35490n [Vreelandella aquamarina]|nr:hypothetical protein HAALTHF_35490n [Halomonas axialensis]
MAGSAIGLAGTLLPALVKRELPQNADLLTGLYTMALCLGGALGAGLSVPLMQWLGNWQASLVSWSLLALATLIVWISYAPSPAPKPTLNLPTGIPPRVATQAAANLAGDALYGHSIFHGIYRFRLAANSSD